MSDHIIDSICGVEPMREDEYPMYYKVGHDGVTRIEGGSYSPEPYCTRLFYQVYKGDQLHSVINDQAVAEVIYASPSELLNDKTN